MLTYRLLRVFSRRDQEHPLYQHIVKSFEQVLPPLFLVLSMLFFPFSLIIFLAAPALFYGVRWSAEIGDTVLRERQSGRYDLLSLTPTGENGVLVTICASYLNRGTSLNEKVWLIIMRVALCLLILSILFDTGTLTPYFEYDTNLSLLVYVSVTLALIIDHYQAIVMACLVGMLAPQWTNDRFNVRLMAAGAFLLLQVATYIVILTLDLLLISDLYDFSPQGTQLNVALIITQLLVFFAVREAAIYGLRRALYRHVEPLKQVTEA